MPACRDCEATEGDYGPLVWAKTPKGAWVLVEPMLHLRNCKGRPRSAKPKAEPKVAKDTRPPFCAQVEADLMGPAFRMTREEAQAQVAGAGPVHDYDSLMLACIKSLGQELVDTS